MRWWPWRKRSTYSIADPALAQYFGLSRSYAGVEVSEPTCLGVPAVWRAVSVVAGTIAGLPMRTVRDVGGRREPLTSFLDERPAGPVIDLTPAEWITSVVLHILLHGNAYLAHVYNAGGALIGLVPVHPLAVTPEWQRVNGQTTGRKTFRVGTDDGHLRDYDETSMTQIMGLASDGLRGYSPITVARHSLGTAIAGDRASAKLYANGAMMSGLVTPDEDIEGDDLEELRQSLRLDYTGVDNAGELAFVNRRLKFTPWTMSSRDAQFIESRQFSVEEIARWFGVPPHLLMQTEKQTSWGTGVAEQNRGLARYTLMGLTRPIEQRLSRLLPRPRFVEFDYVGLLRPAPEQEIPLLIAQVQAGLMTSNEARAVRGLPPVDGGDVLRVGAGAPGDLVGDVA